MGNQMKIMRVSDLIEREKFENFIQERLSKNIIFLKKVDKIFKLGVCKLKTKQARAEKIIKFVQSNRKNEYLFNFCLFCYLTEHFYAERTAFDDIKFLGKINEVLGEFNILLKGNLLEEDL